MSRLAGRAQTPSRISPSRAFRSVSRSKVWWNFAFTAGSTLAAFCQGIILAGLIQGIRVENGTFAGGGFEWATPFALLCGLGLVSGYALLGATFLVMKTTGPVADRARQHAKLLLLAVLGLMGLVSLWTPLTQPAIAQRWFSLPNILYLWPVPVITALIGFGCWRALENGREIRPFFAAIAMFLLGYLGLVISWFPYLVPPSITIWQAAAPPASQIFILLGTLVFLPLALTYTVLVYWLFRGKVQPGESYH